MDLYGETPARLRAANAAHHAAPVTFDWNWPDTGREPIVPELIVPWGDWVDSPDRCSCDPWLPSCIVAEPISPKRQIETIEVSAEDAMTDVGQELFNLLGERRIDTVLVMGVHANLCVLSREFGIRQLVYSGKNPVLCRDLTDSFHRHPAGHFAGNRIVVDHIALHWCETTTSDRLVGGKAFRFNDEES